MSRALFTMALAVLVLAACGSSDTLDPNQSGQVIYVRHARTEMRTEPEMLNLADCAWQRNLSEEGRRQAKALGEEVRKLGLSVSTVLSSGFCRARQTAEIAFGRYEVWAPLTYHANQTPQQLRDNVQMIRIKVGQRQPPGTVLILVSHETGLRDALGISLLEGEAAILQPEPDGSARLLRVLKPRG